MLIQIQNIKKFTIHRFNPTHKNNKKEGAFFPYYNKTNIDLTMCQIYKGEVDYEYNCLIYALMMSNEISMDIIKRVMLICNSDHVPFTSMEKIANLIECTITIRCENDSSNLKRFGKFEKVISLGLIKDHYFLIYKTDYTAFSVENYEEVKHLENFSGIYARRSDGKYKYSSDRGLDTFKLIKKMLEHDMFIPITTSQVMKTQYGKNIKQTYDDLTYPTNAIKEIKNKKDSKPKKIIVFDFETDPNEEHIPYLCCCYDGITMKRFIGLDCGKQLLDYIPNDCLLIAHNAGYDYRFIIKYLININEISRGNHLLSATANYYNKRIQIKDSYNLITMPLRDFGKIFKLEIKKQIMPYKLYTQDNIKKQYVDIEQALEYVEENEKEEFLKNIHEWNLYRDDNTYDIIEYSGIYCEFDCKVLYEGYTIFSGWILDQLKIDINGILTTASLAHQYFIQEGCYN